MRRLSWLVTLPFGALLIAFAVSNRSLVTIELWPLPWSLHLPLFLPLIGGTALGLAMGAGLVAISRGYWRRRARRALKRAEAAEAELARLRTQTPPRALIGARDHAA